MWVTFCHFLGRDRKVRRLYYGELGPITRFFFFKNFFSFFLAFRPHANGVFGHQNRRFLKTLDCRFVHVDER